MASADMTKELECPICLQIYTDPVNLKCGHNFCRVCINQSLDAEEGSGGYSCPECRERFLERPTLHRNMTLRNLVQNPLFVYPNEIGIFCASRHCPGSAVISRLLSEASLCNNPKSPEHVLYGSTASPETRKCSVHQKTLEYYCAEDSALICVFCMLRGEHRGHQVETLDEASEKVKNMLRKVLQELVTKGEEMEKRVRSLQERSARVEGEAAGETQNIAGVFRDLRAKLEVLEKNVLSEVSTQSAQVSLSLTDMIQKLEKREDELSRKRRHIEELLSTAGPLTILEMGDLCDTEDGDEEKHDELLHEGGVLVVAGISHTLHTGLSDIMLGVTMQQCTGTHVYQHSSMKEKVVETGGPSKPCPQPTSSRCLQAGGQYLGAKQPILSMSPFTDILLDVSTAGGYLHISDDRKNAHYFYGSQKRQQTPDRFEGPMVLSSQVFSSGRHYWEVDVHASRVWAVGMCYPSICRKASWIGWNRQSWGLERRNSQYMMRHNGISILLPNQMSIKRVRIDLDFDAGLISFYNLCDPIQHLHTFTTTFTHPLHAVIGVDLNGWIRISGGNQGSVWLDNNVRGDLERKLSQ